MSKIVVDTKLIREENNAYQDQIIDDFDDGLKVSLETVQWSTDTIDCLLDEIELLREELEAQENKVREYRVVLNHLGVTGG